MEKLVTTTLLGGLACFLLAWVLSGWLPLAHLSRLEYKSVEQLVPEATADFTDLARRYPEAFNAAYGSPTAAAFREALQVGKSVYIAEGCWHCHSQFVRPVSNEDVRFGKVAWAGEAMNEMNLPHLYGTRRVGPDLSREAGRHGNDWHAAHLFDPRSVSPTSVMPPYPWLFDGEVPNKRGLGLVSYLQWLGSWATPEALARMEAKHVAR